MAWQLHSTAWQCFLAHTLAVSGRQDAPSPRARLPPAPYEFLRKGVTLRRRGTQRPPHARPQPQAIMEWSRRTKLAEESISCALRLEAPLQPVGHTRHFDPSPSAIAEMIFASSGWRLANFCVSHMSRARPRASCKRKRSTAPKPLSTRTGLPKATATTRLRRSSAPARHRAETRAASRPPLRETTTEAALRPPTEARAPARDAGRGRSL